MNNVAPAGMRSFDLVLPFLAVFSAAMVVLNTPLAAIVRELRLPDTDDAMRLVQVFDLLGGQGWFDKTQYRLLPPGGAPMHWSRIVDLPLALGIVGLRPFVGDRLAAGLVAAIWPATLLAAYLGTLWIAARRWFGPRASWLALLAATQMTTIGLFAPGRIDHHNLQILAALGVAFGLCDQARDRRGALLRGLCAGSCAAISLAIGLETLPFVGLAGAAVACAWVARRTWAAPRFAGYGMALATGSLLLFAAETQPAAWRVPHGDALSLPWLTLTCLGGACAAVLCALPLRGRTARCTAAAVAGGLTLAPLILFFGDLLLHPLGPLSEVVRHEWLDKVAEALPLPLALAYSPEMVAGGMLPLAVASAYAFRQAWTTRFSSKADRFLFLGATLALGVVISTIQLRGIYIASAVLPLVAARALDGALTLIGQRGRSGRLASALGIALLMLGKVAALPVVAVQNLTGHSPAVSVTRHLSDCAEPRSVARLAALPSATILAPVDLGTAILLHTPHGVIAAPYHRAARGIEAALLAFSGNEADLRREVDRTGADVVALCRSWLAGQPDGFARRIASGGQAAWLEPIVLPPGDLMAWHVVPRRRP